MDNIHCHKKVKEFSLIREKVKRDIIMIYNYTQAIRKADTTEINISNQMHKKTRIT